MRRSQWPFSLMSLLISSLRSRSLRHVGKLSPQKDDAKVAVIPQALSLELAKPCILYFHDLFANLLDNLIPPLVRLVQVDALCGQVRPPLLWSSRFILFCSQKPVEHRLGFLLIAGHLGTELLKSMYKGLCYAYGA